MRETQQKTAQNVVNTARESFANARAATSATFAKQIAWEALRGHFKLDRIPESPADEGRLGTETAFARTVLEYVTRTDAVVLAAITTDDQYNFMRALTAASYVGFLRLATHVNAWSDIAEYLPTLEAAYDASMAFGTASQNHAKVTEYTGTNNPLIQLVLESLKHRGGFMGSAYREAIMTQAKLCPDHNVLEDAAASLKTASDKMTARNESLKEVVVKDAPPFAPAKSVFDHWSSFDTSSGDSSDSHSDGAEDDENNTDMGDAEKAKSASAGSAAGGGGYRYSDTAATFSGLFTHARSLLSNFQNKAPVLMLGVPKQPSLDEDAHKKFRETFYDESEETERIRQILRDAGTEMTRENAAARYDTLGGFTESFVEPTMAGF